MSEFYPRSRPRKSAGGIKARSVRGPIGERWWSRRFIDVLESFGLQTRLTRGRAYARSGQVLSLDIGTGHASAAARDISRVVVSNINGRRAYSVPIIHSPRTTVI